MQLHKLTLALFFSLSLLSCEDNESDLSKEDNDSTQSVNQNSGSTDTQNNTQNNTALNTNTVTNTQNQTFTQTQVQICESLETILTDYACTACHSDNPENIGGGLDLLSNDRHLRLVNQPSLVVGCEDELLIDANTPSNSLLLKLIDQQKYEAWGDNACTAKMPTSDKWLSREEVDCVESYVYQAIDNSDLEQNTTSTETDSTTQTQTQSQTDTTTDSNTTTQTDTQSEVQICESFDSLLNGYACTTCHNITPDILGGKLDLVSSDRHLRLVGKPSLIEGCEDELLIDHEMPGNSLLLKLVDQQRYEAWGENACSRRMPTTGDWLSDEAVSCMEGFIQQAINDTDLSQIEPEEVIEFEVINPLTGLIKVKYLLTGEVVSQSEIDQIIVDNQIDQSMLAQNIKLWQSTDLYQHKIKDFMRIALQQKNQGENFAYNAQLDRIGNNKPVDRNWLFDNLVDYFPLTAMDIINNNEPFNKVINTKTYQVTTAVLAALSYADSNPRQELRFDDLPGLTQADFNDWREVEFGLQSEAATFEFTEEFSATLRAVPANSVFTLRTPRVGFFSTLPFYNTFQTNSDNQFRITTNQTLITAIGEIFETNDVTVQHNQMALAQLDPDHAPQDSACYDCHRLLDPMRKVFMKYQDYDNRGKEFDDSQIASFAFKGVNADINTMHDLANTLANHPLFASAWAQKVCLWANSQKCNSSDPVFKQVIENFKDGFSFNDLIVDIFSSQLVHANTTSQTFESSEFFISLSRSNHFCHALNTRNNKVRVERGLEPMGNLCSTTQSVSLIPRDGYARGDADFVQSTLLGAFQSKAYDYVCRSISNKVVGSSNAFDPNDYTTSIKAIVEDIMGILPNQERYPIAIEELTFVWDVSREKGNCADLALDIIDDNQSVLQCGLSLSKGAAMKNVWYTACTSNDVIGLGF
ncbi:MAG: hypothetical protein HRU38_02715 [Saccharospirillaceae bacterium]|nr:hypothetical protein [Saccharospirillaceae bacterium]